MNDKCFIDTNIIVYCYSVSEPEKQSISRKLIVDNITYVSTQVLQELTNIVVKKLQYSYETAKKAILETCSNNNLHTNTFATITTACNSAAQYKFSFYDSLIISAALETNSRILYSEDLRHGQIIENRLTIINPFITE